MPSQGRRDHEAGPADRSQQNSSVVGSSIECSERSKALSDSNVIDGVQVK